MKHTFKELHEAFNKGKTVKLMTPDGYKKVSAIHTKFGTGRTIDFNDGSSITGYDYHLVHSGYEFVPLVSLKVGSWVDDENREPYKEVVKITEVEEQLWYDFTLDYADECYVQNDILHHNSGKSLILYMLTMYIQEILKFENILIIVPTVGLVTQLHSDFCEYAVDNPNFDPDNILLVPNSKGIKYDKTKNITITTWQSMMSVLKGQDAKEFFSKYEALLVDEVHTMAANIAKEIALTCSNTPIKIGMTGTLSNTKTGELAIKGLFGPVYKTTTTADLIESGTLTDVRIKAIQVDHKGFSSLKKKLEYIDENQYIRTCTPRTEFISKLATRVSNSGNTLVLYQNLDQGKALYETISELAEGKHVFLVNGSTKAEVRENVRKFAESNNDVIIIAGFQIFATGINIKNLHNLIFASPSKSMIRILQSVGRILRTHHSKDIATVYDIYDSFDYRQKSAKSFGVMHFVERFRIYSEAQLQVEVIQGPSVEVTL